MIIEVSVTERDAALSLWRASICASQDRPLRFLRKYLMSSEDKYSPLGGKKTTKNSWAATGHW